MKKLDTSTLTSDEFAMFNTSKMKLRQTVDSFFALAEFPPFNFDANGESSPLKADFLKDINLSLLEVDEEDFITDRYNALQDIKTKYKKELEQARAVRDSAETPGKAIKKWFDERGLKMDESVAYYYGAE